MKLAVLFTGGKDSCYALNKAMEKNEVVCLITIVSENKESYMYHTPNIELTKIQAQSIGLPIIVKDTQGVKEVELKELEEAINEAKEKFQIEGIVTGAVESVYQGTRVQRICNKLDLWCFNPLWKKNQEELLKEIIDKKFEAIISGVFAYPLDISWLGRKIDLKMVNELVELSEGRYKISPTGEGGEFETTVLNAPFFNKKLIVKKKGITDMVDSGRYDILEVELE